MELDPKEQKDGMRWLILGGLGAIAVSVFLVGVDFYLTNSKSEQVKADNLRGLRAAQFSMPKRQTDSRVLGHKLDSKLSDSNLIDNSLVSNNDQD